MTRLLLLRLTLTWLRRRRLRIGHHHRCPCSRKGFHRRSEPSQHWPGKWTASGSSSLTPAPALALAAADVVVSMVGEQDEAMAAGALLLLGKHPRRVLDAHEARPPWGARGQLAIDNAVSLVRELDHGEVGALGHEAAAGVAARNIIGAVENVKRLLRHVRARHGGGRGACKEGSSKAAKATKSRLEQK